MVSGRFLGDYGKVSGRFRGEFGVVSGRFRGGWPERADLGGHLGRQCWGF